MEKKYLKKLIYANRFIQLLSHTAKLQYKLVHAFIRDVYFIKKYLSNYYMA